MHRSHLPVHRTRCFVPSRSCTHTTGCLGTHEIHSPAQRWHSTRPSQLQREKKQVQISQRRDGWAHFATKNKRKPMLPVSLETKFWGPCGAGPTPVSPEDWTQSESNNEKLTLRRSWQRPEALQAETGCRQGTIDRTRSRLNYYHRRHRAWGLRCEIQSLCMLHIGCVEHGERHTVSTKINQTKTQRFTKRMRTHISRTLAHSHCSCIRLRTRMRSRRTPCSGASMCSRSPPHRPSPRPASRTGFPPRLTRTPLHRRIPRWCKKSGTPHCSHCAWSTLCGLF